jgi:hypothetical protein
MKKDILALTFAVVTVGAHADRAMAYTMVITHMRRFVRVDPDLSVTSMVQGVRDRQRQGRAGDRAMVLQEPIDSSLGHKAALGVREVDGELPRDSHRLRQRKSRPTVRIRPVAMGQ